MTEFDEVVAAQSAGFPVHRLIPSTGAQFYCDYVCRLSIDELRLLWEYAMAIPALDPTGISRQMISALHYSAYERYREAYAASSGDWRYISCDVRKMYIGAWQNGDQLMDMFRQTLGETAWQKELITSYLHSNDIYAAARTWFIGRGYIPISMHKNRYFRFASRDRDVEIELMLGNAPQLRNIVNLGERRVSLETLLGILAPSEWDLITSVEQVDRAFELIAFESDRVAKPRPGPMKVP